MTDNSSVQWWRKALFTEGAVLKIEYLVRRHPSLGTSRERTQAHEGKVLYSQLRRVSINFTLLRFFVTGKELRIPN